MECGVRSQFCRREKRLFLGETTAGFSRGAVRVLQRELCHRLLRGGQARRRVWTGRPGHRAARGAAVRRGRGAVNSLRARPLPGGARLSPAAGGTVSLHCYRQGNVTP